jgi:hypothetical protein
MSELLGLPTRTEKNKMPSESLMPSAGGMHAKLVKADFHGSIMQGKHMPSRVDFNIDQFFIQYDKVKTQVWLV